MLQWNILKIVKNVTLSFDFTVKIQIKLSRGRYQIDIIKYDFDYFLTGLFEVRGCPTPNF